MNLNELTDQIKSRLAEIEKEYNDAKERYETLSNELDTLRKMLAAAEGKSVADDLIGRIEKREKEVYIPYPYPSYPWWPSPYIPPATTKPYVPPIEITAYGVPLTSTPVYAAPYEWTTSDDYSVTLDNTGIIFRNLS
jgi:hypothetical protein